MPDDLKKKPDEPDPLSATAMFLRALDQQPGTEQPEPAVKSDPVFPQVGARRDVSPSGIPGTEKTGEFTELFGGSRSLHPAPAQSSSPDQASPNPASAAPTRSGQAPGEFTRIFVKDLPSPPAKPAVRNADERPEPLPSPPPRPKGFSTPGASDAASAETSFTQIFRPGARPTPGAAQPSEASARPEPSRENSPSPIPAGRATESGPPKFDPSITSLIESLSSPSSSAGSQRAPEPTPYRADSMASFQPVAKPAQPPAFDAGGVTIFIQRLADPAPAPREPLPPVHEPSTEQGEFTRIISAPRIDSNAAPLPAPPPPAPSPEIAFARPPAPQIQPIQVVPPQAHVAMPQPHVAMPQAHAAAAPVAAPKIPAPHLPPIPAPAPPPAPKGKLESLVPMLLVVNTFLLVVILVVMIFLIKAR